MAKGEEQNEKKKKIRIYKFARAQKGKKSETRDI
jgi:hypothetical protein